MLPKKNKLIPGILAAALCLSGCTPASVPEPAAKPVTGSLSASIPEIPLRDPAALYTDDPYNVVTMYLTVYPENAHTALLQVGDENGPSPGALGYGERLPNVQLQGQDNSYLLQLTDNAPGWRGQSTIVLNKFSNEALRFRSKLMFDLMADVPQLMSLRTQFVHLYVRDPNGAAPDLFEDHGLYTQVEELDRAALRTHGLDENGSLYQAEHFSFFMEEALDPGSELPMGLKALNSTDHTRLLEMLRAVNDWTISSDRLLDTCFDRENLAYWMAFMMLSGNSDVRDGNFCLYSPRNSTKWYLYPRGMDTALPDTELKIRQYSDFCDWQDGITNYWGSLLFRRALISESFRQLLDKAVEDLRSHYLTDQLLQERIAGYAEAVKPYLFRMPDRDSLSITQEQHSLVLETLFQEVERNYNRYRESLLSPMPFSVSMPERTADGYLFTWEDAVNFANETLTYHFILSRDEMRSEVIAEADRLAMARCSYSTALDPGQYFIHVCAVNESGHVTNCSDRYRTSGGFVYGTCSFFLEKDGSIRACEAEEAAHR